MRMDRSLRCGVPRPRPQAAPDVRRREPPAGLGEEQRLLAVAGVERAASALQIAPDGAQRVLPGRHEAGLAALALDTHLLGVEVDRARVEVDQLLGAQAAGVREL